MGRRHCPLGCYSTPNDSSVKWASAPGAYVHGDLPRLSHRRLCEVAFWHVLSSHPLNRGNVLEGPLTDRIGDAGDPGCQGQVATPSRPPGAGTKASCVDDPVEARAIWYVALRSGVSGEVRGRAPGELPVLQRVIRPCRSVRGTPLLARRQCARLFSGNCPIRVDSRFCRAHPYRDKSPRCD